MRGPNNIGKVTEYCMLIGRVRISVLLKVLLLLLSFSTLTITGIKAQDIYNPDKESTPFVYDEIPVILTVEGYGSFNLDVIYTNNNMLFINVEDLFKTLKIQCKAGLRGDSLRGFIENESRTYLIDYNNRQIKVGDKIFNSQNGLVKEMGTIFIESTLFAEAFGIRLTFNYRALSIQLKSSFELPIIKELRIEKLRNNLSKVKGEETFDTAVQRNYHLFKFGTLDWAAVTTQTLNGSADNRFRLGLGTEFLYGEANVSFDYYNQQKYDNRQLQYQWLWVDNDKSIIKQAQVGTIPTQTIAFINSPVIGAVIRSSPTTVRKASGYYTINETTEPNWTVELYLNNELIDFTKADASGIFTFKVPIIYGYTTLKLKFYGPMGEERIDERTMNVPYTFMPANEFEYGISGGILQDSSSSRFGKADFNYGIDRMFTLGGGIEYLSSITNGPFIPYLKASIQPYSKLTINAEYAYGVRTRGLLSYYLGQNALIELDYSKYEEGQRATLLDAPEERKIKLSLPFRFKSIIGFAKLDYTKLIYKEFSYDQGNIMLSMYYKRFSANSSTQINWIEQRTPYISSDLALSYRLKNGFNLRSTAQLNLNDGNLMRVKAELEKLIPKGYFSIAYERNILFNDNYITLNLKYDLPFARANITTTHSKNNAAISESAQGSLAFGSGDVYVHKSNNPSVGKGGISLYPFLDTNHNGIFDKGEHMVKVTSVEINGGKVIFSEKDSIIRIPDLNAFTKYIVEFNDNDLENIAWRFKNKKYQVLIDPNQFKHIDIPIIPLGEVSGTISIISDNSKKAIGRILVNVYKKNGTKVLTGTLSESDGYIYYLGLMPGDYTARIDSAQLSNLNLTADPPQIDFTIKQSENGDIVGGINFVLSRKEITVKPGKEAIEPKH